MKTLAGQLLDQIASCIRWHKRYPLSFAALGYLFIAVTFSYYPVADHWLTGFVIISLPIALVLGAAAVIYLFLQKEQMVATSGLVWLLFSLLVVKRLMGFQTNEPKLYEGKTLKVLSFNGETFPEHIRRDLDAKVFQTDIACFQEYSPNAWVESKFAQKVERLTSFTTHSPVGLALFSNYPVIQQYGRIWDRANQPDINGYLCADIAYEADTIRIVNVHLWSMGIRTDQAVSALKEGNYSRFVWEVADTFLRLKQGFQNRHEQFKEVESYIAGSRYPVIICGDFNELPIGFTYGRLSKNFKNAFEEAGQGLGFTLNRHPYCVRIDHQFVSSDWRIKACQTLSDVTCSDHYPVLAQYVLKNK